MIRLFILLCLLSCSARADILLDIMNGNHESYELPPVEIIEASEAEHYSWELGTNESIPETVIIFNPYGSGCDDSEEYIP